MALNYGLLGFTDGLLWGIASFFWLPGYLQVIYNVPYDMINCILYTTEYIYIYRGTYWAT